MSALLALLLAASPPNTDLAAAEKAASEGRFEEVLPALERARAQGLGLEEQAQAYELEAFTDAAFEDFAGARRAFDALLELKPDYVLPATASPKMEGILLEAKGARVRREQPPPPVSAAPAFDRLHLGAAALMQLSSPNAFGGLLSATWSILPAFEAGLGAGLGRNPSLELILGLSPWTDGRWRPFLQLRGMAFFTGAEVAWGGGAWGGLGFGVGPGRLQAGLGGELYRAPTSFAGAALLLRLGYELDPGALLR